MAAKASVPTKVLFGEMTATSPGVYQMEPLQVIGIKSATHLPGMLLYMPHIEQNGSSLIGGQ